MSFLVCLNNRGPWFRWGFFHLPVKPIYFSTRPPMFTDFLPRKNHNALPKHRATAKRSLAEFDIAEKQSVWVEWGGRMGFRMLKNVQMSRLRCGVPLYWGRGIWGTQMECILRVITRHRSLMLVQPWGEGQFALAS